MSLLPEGSVRLEILMVVSEYVPLVAIIILPIVFLCMVIAYEEKKKREYCEWQSQVFEGRIPISLDSFEQLRQANRGRLQYIDFRGVFILHNTTKERYYLNGSRAVLKRTAAQFSGGGDRMIYSDFCAGDFFGIRLFRYSEESDIPFDEWKAEIEKNFREIHPLTHKYS